MGVNANATWMSTAARRSRIGDPDGNLFLIRPDTKFFLSDTLAEKRFDSQPGKIFKFSVKPTT